MGGLLVTGGAGFIGSNFIRYLVRRDPGLQIVCLDALTYSGNLENLAEVSGKDRFRFLQGNICDRKGVEGILKDQDIDSVVHFAAETHVDRSILSPEPFVQSNIVGTAVLLESVRGYWMSQPDRNDSKRRFHHISTDEVYGSLTAEDLPCSEESPYRPNSPYAASKAASDHLVRAYGHTYHLPYLITNCTNNYGPFQYPEKFIPLMILNALDGKKMPLYGDGRQIRDWLYVEDHCEALEKVLTRGIPGSSYHIGSGNQLANIEIAEMICEILDERKPNSPHRPHRQWIQLVKDRPGHDRRYALDTGKIKRELDWHPRFTIQDGLHKTVDWYLAHPEWVDGIRQRKEYRSWIEAQYIP